MPKQVKFIWLSSIYLTTKQHKKLSVNLADLGIKGKCFVTDMWTGKTVGTFSKEFSRLFNSHACGLYKLKVK
jgi:hypothetical protein